MASRPPPPPPPHPDARIPQLIAALADDDFAAREAASKALVEVGEPALPALQEAAKADNLEIQARARTAIQAIQSALVQPQEVLDRLYGAGAFVEGGALTLRDALKPVEQMGLRIQYGEGVDPAEPVTLQKYGQTALELIDHLAEAGRLGFQIVPGGVRVLPVAGLDAIHRDLGRRLETERMSLQGQEMPQNEILAAVSAKLGAPVVFSPSAPAGYRADRKTTLHVNALAPRTLLHIVLQRRERARIEPRYGMVVLSIPNP